MASILEQIKDNPLSRLPARIKQLPPALQVGAGALIGGAAATLTPVQIGVTKAATNTLNLIKANPIISGVTGIVGAGAIAREPTKAAQLVDKAIPTAQKGVSSLYDFGGDVAQITTPKDVLNVAKEHPLITSGLGLVLAGSAARGLSSGIILGKTLSEDNNKGFSSYLDYTPITPDIKTSSNSSGSGIPQLNDQKTRDSFDTTTASPSYPEPTTQLVSYTDKKPVARMKRKKAKTINTTPINIRNNILIANKG